jgi:hypothetical protein
MPRHRTKNMAVEEHASATAERKTPSGAKGAPPTAILLCSRGRGMEGKRWGKG